MKIAPILALLAGTVWGTLGLFTRQMQNFGLGSLEIAFVRMSIAFLTIGTWLFLFRRDLLKIRLKDLWCFAGAGVGSVLMFSLCYFNAVKYTSLAVATVLVYSAPVYVILFSAVLFREKITGRKIAALMVALVGYVLVSGIGRDSETSIKGLLLSICAGFFYSLYSIFGKLAMQRGYQALTLTFYSFLFCAVGCAFFADFSALGGALRQGTGAVFWFAGTGIVTGFIPYVLYSIALQKMESGVAIILSSVELVAEAVVGWLVFRETLTPTKIFGGTLVIGAIVLLNISKRSR